MRVMLLLLLAGCTAGSAQSLSLQHRTSTPPEMGLLRFLELSCAGHTYTLVPPGPDWRLQLDPAQDRLQLFPFSGAGGMALRFATNAARDVLASADTLRQHAAPELTQVHKLAELEVFGGNAAGKAADFAYTLQGSAMRCRVAALPLPSGTVSFVLHCGAEEFAAAQQTFGALLNTFQRTSRTAAETAGAEAQKLAARAPTISGN